MITMFIVVFSKRLFGCWLKYRVFTHSYIASNQREQKLQHPNECWKHPINPPGFQNDKTSGNTARHTVFRTVSPVPLWATKPRNHRPGFAGDSWSLHCGERIRSASLLTNLFFKLFHFGTSALDWSHWGSKTSEPRASLCHTYWS